ncbi:MAG: TonB-dependent receptor [Gemmatimonadetes bacterium]|nr:TonB-dependent receptor [Gemmatimonadota bacterium]
MYLLLLLVCCTALATLPTSAQTPLQGAARAGTISGRVVDAATVLPLVGAAVVLEPRDLGAFPVRAPGGSAFIHSTRSAVTDSAGRYRFGEVPEGEYRLHVQRIGYRATTLGVELRGASDSRVSVGLTVEPVALEPIQVSTPAAPRAPSTYQRTVSSEAEGNARIAAERVRQRQYLSSDVRAVTHSDVVESVTLGETDLFRALQRLPGVSARDEYAAELWIRGAPWDHTRVYFDGLPLFSPLHGLGLFSAINPDAVGAAFLHPGVQPAWASGGAAGMLDLRTRAGSEEGELHGLGEVSLASSRLALDGGSGDGRHSWMVAGRRSYLDWLTGIAESILGRDNTYQFPYSFSDLTARSNYRLGANSTIEISGLLQRNAVGNDNPNILNAVAARWGAGATRATLQIPLGGFHTRHSAGFSGFGSSVSHWGEDWDWRFGHEAVHRDIAAQQLSSGIRYGALEGEVQPLASATWSAGYQLVSQHVRFSGPRPTPFTPLEPGAYGLHREDGLTSGALWANRRWKPVDALTLETGLRLETASAANESLHWAPRLTARYQLTPGTSISGGMGRSYQHLQSVAPAGPSPERGFRTDQLWVLAGDSVPTLRTDIATLGAESWIGGWIASVTTYLRHSTGVAMPDPVPGPTLDRALFVTGESRARGVDLSVRRLAGPWTASAAYSFSSSERSVGGLRFPAPEDQRHVFDATALMRLDPRWRLGAAYTAASGAPYTRIFRGSTRCTAEGVCSWSEEPWTGAPGEQRTRSYQSLDLLVDWTRKYRKWESGAFLQVRNALYHSNPGRYLGLREEYVCRGGATGSCTPQKQDEFLPGLPILPLIGFRVAF